MPARSNKQRRWAFAVKGAAWAKRHHFDKVRRKSKKSGGGRRRKRH